MCELRRKWPNYKCETEVERGDEEEERGRVRIQSERKEGRKRGRNARHQTSQFSNRLGDFCTSTLKKTDAIGAKIITQLVRHFPMSAPVGGTE